MSAKVPRNDRRSGFALAALIFFLTAASILIAAAVPVYQMQAKRIQEEELIFRGEEYMRAIQKFQRKFGVYPPSVDAMLETNGLKFLRKAYKDPMTGKPFRLIYLNTNGTLNGSTVFNQTGNPQQLFGAGSQLQGQQNRGNSPNQQSPFGQGQPNQQTPFGQGQPNQQSPFGQGQPNQPGINSGLTPLSQPQSQQFSTLSRQQPTVGQQPSLSNQPNQLNQPNQPNQPGNGSAGTAGIVGVASTSEEKSVKVYNKRQKYNEWEFIAVLQSNMQNPNQNPNGLQPGVGGSSGTGPRGNGPGFGPNTQQPGFGQPGFGQPGLGQPGTNPSQQPFGFGSPQSPQFPRRPE